MNLSEIVDRTQAYYCLDCGICTGSCPVSRVMPDFSPRLMVEKVLIGEEENPLEDINVWSCLSCGQCSTRCPSNIDYPEFVRMVREEAVAKGKGGTPAHRGLFQTVMRLQTMDVKQQKTDWAREAGKVSSSGDIYFSSAALPFSTWNSATTGNLTSWTRPAAYCDSSIRSGSNRLFMMTKDAADMICFGTETRRTSQNLPGKMWT